MTARRMKTYVVNLRRRPDRRARMERLLPASWDVQYTSDWDGPMDGQAIDPGHLPGFGLYPWQVSSGNPWRLPSAAFASRSSVVPMRSCEMTGLSCDCCGGWS